MKHTQKIIISSLLFACLFVASSAFAKQYNPSYLISQSEYENYSSMSREYVQRFLEDKGSGLATISVDTDNGKKRVSDLFYDYSQEYRVSPKLLLATAQKESSAITDGSIADWQKSNLMGYGIYPGSDPSDYLGLDNQIRRAAWQFRRYIDKPQNFGFREGETKTTNDGVTVTPENAATAGLYNYTPHAGGDSNLNESDTGGGGNFLFWKIWQQWFAKFRPSGTLIQVKGEPGVYVIYGERKRAFWSREVFDAFGYTSNDVIQVDKSTADGYKTLSPVKYPDGTLIKSPGGTVYIIDHGIRRGFASREVFDHLGYTFKQVFDSRWGEVNLYPEGEPIDEITDFHANGTLVKSPHDGSVWQIWDNERRPIVDRTIFDRNFHWDKVITVSVEQFEQYPIDDPVKMRDGTLMRGPSNDMWVVEFGKRRFIPRSSIVDDIGYESNDAVNVPQHVIDIHPEGALFE